MNIFYNLLAPDAKILIACCITICLVMLIGIITCCVLIFKHNKRVNPKKPAVEDAEEFDSEQTDGEQGDDQTLTFNG